VEGKPRLRIMAVHVPEWVLMMLAIKVPSVHRTDTVTSGAIVKSHLNNSASDKLLIPLKNEWWAVTDLNCGPKDYESSALTN
jgi:hypothetical protein